MKFLTEHLRELKALFHQLDLIVILLLIRRINRCHLFDTRYIYLDL